MTKNMHRQTHGRQNTCSYSTLSSCAHCDMSDVPGHNFPHASRTYGYLLVHALAFPVCAVLAFPVCAVLYPVSSRALLACLCFPTLHVFLDPPTCDVMCPRLRRASLNCQAMYHPHCVLIP